MEYNMAPSFGFLEIQALAYLQARPTQTLAAGELAPNLGWTPIQERKILSQLTRKGQLARVRRGLYLAPRQLPLGGRWSPGEILALTTLINDRQGKYQISGPNAFRRYGWSDQIPNRVCAYNNRLSGDRQVGTVTLTLIKVADDRLGDTEVVPSPEGPPAVYASRPRALVDAVYDWARFDTLPRAFNWIEREVAADPDFAARFVQTTIAFGNQGTLRRVGAALERLDVSEPLLRRIERALRPSSSFIPMNPTAAKRGKPDQARTSNRWRVVLNQE